LTTQLSGCRARRKSVVVEISTRNPTVDIDAMTIPLVVGERG
jgi:hypothetical protein